MRIWVGEGIESIAAVLYKKDTYVLFCVDVASPAFVHFSRVAPRPAPLLNEKTVQNFVLDGNGEGYPLTPAHTDLRDTEITASPESNLEEYDRQSFSVDLSRSVW